MPQAGQPGVGPKPSRPWVVPLFPLPNVVLLPRAVLPLHVFEERYKVMTAHALLAHGPLEPGRIAMAMLRPGWEKNYHSRPEIEPVVCVGQILSHERLADGKYNFLLQGTHRCGIVREVGDQPYRQAEVLPIAETSAAEADLVAERRRLAAVFESDALAAIPVARKFAQVLAGEMPTSDVADLVAFSFIEDVPLKQHLLTEPDVRARVRRVAEELEALIPTLRPRRRPAPPGTGLN